MTKSQRHKALVRRRIFVSACAVILAAVILLIAFAVKAVVSRGEKDNASSDVSSIQSESVSGVSDLSDVSSKQPSTPSSPRLQATLRQDLTGLTRITVIFCL